MLNLKAFIFGTPQNPLLKKNTTSHALVAFLAWIGLGADGLSSSCYGPALGYQALGSYTHLALFLALLTAATVFLIALSYNQVIQLFPNGGGGYKVANTILGPAAGLVSGTALLIDYMLTISISIASGVEAVYSLFPAKYATHMILVECTVILLLMFLNMRGTKESIKILLPIFLGFFITHLIIIVYGIAMHGQQLPGMLSDTVKETHTAVHHLGFIVVLAILLKAYSLGSGTYTGLEAVSNNVNILSEPRVKTGQTTMLYMAISLSVVASGIIVLYLLWNVHPVDGMTLNAVVFQKILGSSHLAHIFLIILLATEAGLLVVGGNTGFLGGPAVLANMSLDDWVPRRFALLSSRLVKQNGVLFFGICATITIILTNGSVELLVILYSINVFITFSISLLSLCVHWWKNRNNEILWKRRIILSMLGFIVCSSILLITVFTKLYQGSWAAVILATIIVILCIVLRNHYRRYEHFKRLLDDELSISLQKDKIKVFEERKLDTSVPTAVILVKGLGGALHTILWIERMFPKFFKNYIFISYGVLDTGSFNSEEEISRLKKSINRTLGYLTSFCYKNGIATRSITEYGIDAIADIPRIAEKINKEFVQNVYFCAQYVYPWENMFVRQLHSGFTAAIQRHLQRIGIKLLIVPLNLEKSK